MASTKLHVTFRISKELGQQLDDVAERMQEQTGVRATRSMVARTVIATALAEDPTQAAVFEVSANIQHVLQWAAQRVVADIKRELPGRLEQGFGNLMTGRGLREDADD